MHTGAIRHIDNGICNQVLNLESCMLFDAGDCCVPGECANVSKLILIYQNISRNVSHFSKKIR
jgi:hypothetical protein